MTLNFWNCVDSNTDYFIMCNYDWPYGEVNFKICYHPIQDEI